MTRYAFLCCLIFSQYIAAAQSFEPKDTLHLENLSNPVFEWIDVNNDTRLDILVTGQDLTALPLSESLTYVYEQQADTTFVLRNTDLETFGEQIIRMADLNQDGRQDLLVSATNGNFFEHTIYLNKGDYTWDKVIIDTGQSRWNELRMTDLDNDGFPEIVTSSEEGLEIYQRTGGGWETVDLPEDFVPVITDPVLADYDKDGFQDILLLGPTTENDSVAMWLINEQDMNFSIQTVESDSLQIVDYVVSDFNGDGFPDVFYSTGANSRTRATQMIMNRSGRELEDSVNVDLLQLKNARVFAADLTSDGIPETDIEGETPGPNSGIISRERAFRGDNAVLYERDTLENTSGEGRRYGDFDFDGDLDFFEVFTTDTSSIIWLSENTEEDLNQGPDGLEDLISFTFRDQTFLVWNRADDDFTDPKSVTYDVSVGAGGSATNLVAGGFDPNTLRRTVVGPGNQGHNDFMILKDAPATELSVIVMPIDNAFHHDVSQCLQGTAASGDCDEEIVPEEVVICGGDFVQLFTQSGQIARWFSYSGGYLGTAPNMGLTVTSDDFVIAVYDRVGGCLEGEVFEIKVDTPLPELPDLSVCLGDSVNVAMPGEWRSITWTSRNQEFRTVINENSISYVPAVTTEPDIITVMAESFLGCRYSINFTVVLSEPTGAVASEVYEIGEGESVRLEASGGRRYLWLPADGLSDNQAANPIASPDVSTEYTVFIFNDAGCAQEFTVNVEVIQTAFAPDAFSPNGDGRNEVFRVYDLDGPVDMTFTIFDRAGNRVFQTSNLSEIAASGWDGNNNGNPVPAGTYFWKVTGTYADGQKILINGDTKGALQLIR